MSNHHYKIKSKKQAKLICKNSNNTAKYEIDQVKSISHNEKEENQVTRPNKAPFVIIIASILIIVFLVLLWHSMITGNKKWCLLAGFVSLIASISLNCNYMVNNRAFGTIAIVLFTFGIGLFANELYLVWQGSPAKFLDSEHIGDSITVLSLTASLIPHLWKTFEFWIK